MMNFNQKGEVRSRMAQDYMIVPGILLPQILPILGQAFPRFQGLWGIQASK
jgi:hypothetical protein